MDSENKKENEYALLNFREEEGGKRTFQQVRFYRLNPDGSYENGTTVEEVIDCALARLSELNTKFTCKENEEALVHLKEAYRFLEMRTADRKARGVEGKHEA